MLRKLYFLDKWGCQLSQTFAANLRTLSEVPLVSLWLQLGWRGGEGRGGRTAEVREGEGGGGLPWKDTPCLQQIHFMLLDLSCGNSWHLINYFLYDVSKRCLCFEIRSKLWNLYCFSCVNVMAWQSIFRKELRLLLIFFLLWFVGWGKGIIVQYFSNMTNCISPDFQTFDNFLPVVMWWGR